MDWSVLYTTTEGLSLVGLLLLGVGVMIWLYHSAKRSAGLIRHDYDLRALKLRLSKYSTMIGYEEKPALEGRHSVQQEYLLSTGEHKILLGVLKKIEAKNAVLAAINIFLLTAGAKIYYDVSGDLNSYQRPTFLATLMLLFILAIARVQGNGHLGQRHFNTTRGRSSGEGAAFLGPSMQEDLMRDLLMKEAVFDFSYRCIVAVFFLGLVVFVLGFVG